MRGDLDPLPPFLGRKGGSPPADGGGKKYRYLLTNTGPTVTKRPPTQFSAVAVDWGFVLSFSLSSAIRFLETVFAIRTRFSACGPVFRNVPLLWPRAVFPFDGPLSQSPPCPLQLKKNTNVFFVILSAPTFLERQRKRFVRNRIRCLERSRSSCSSRKTR